MEGILFGGKPRLERHRPCPDCGVFDDRFFGSARCRKCWRRKNDAAVRRARRGLQCTDCRAAPSSCGRLCADCARDLGEPGLRADEAGGAGPISGDVLGDSDLARLGLVLDSLGFDLDVPGFELLDFGAPGAGFGSAPDVGEVERALRGQEPPTALALERPPAVRPKAAPAARSSTGRLSSALPAALSSARPPAPGSLSEGIRRYLGFQGGAAPPAAPAAEPGVLPGAPKRARLG